MLAFESAWRVLMTEHGQIRELLDAIERALAQGVEPLPGGVRGLLEQLQAFDSATHRPKGEALVKALRGKSAETDALLAAHEREQAACDQLLRLALALLDRAERGDAKAQSECAELLARHRALLREHLAKEDTALRAAAARWLTPEDCSAIVSSISSVVHPAPRAGSDER